MSARTEITAELVREMLDYDPESGLFVWKVNRGSATAGDPAGAPNSMGHLRITIGRKTYFSHRLAWLFVYGEWPKGEIDHVNRNRADNRISNLRDVTRSENHFNSAGHRHNTSGFKGVSYCKARGNWEAHCQVNGKKYQAGRFSTAEEANEAAKALRRKLHGDYFCDSAPHYTEILQ